jgi:hypothetical protein
MFLVVVRSAAKIKDTEMTKFYVKTLGVLQWGAEFLNPNIFLII